MTSASVVLPEKTIFDVLYDMWRARYYMLFSAIIMLIFAFIFLGLSQKFYKAEMIIAPATHMGQGMEKASQIGEGSIYVQHENLQTNAAFLRFEHIYSGASVASILLHDDKIISALEFDRNFEFSKGKSEWNVSDLSQYLKDRVKLEPVNGTILRKMVYLHPNKNFAAYMIGKIHLVSDLIIRKTILKQTNDRIDYLNKALSSTTNTGHRASLTALLMEQERLKMMVSLDQPYAASIIEKPFVYSDYKYPDPYLVYTLFLFVGLFMGFIIYGLRHYNE